MFSRRTLNDYSSNDYYGSLYPTIIAWPSVFISKGKYVQDEFKERLFQGSYRTRNKPQLFSGTKKAEV